MLKFWGNRDIKKIFSIYKNFDKVYRQLNIYLYIF